MRNRKCSGNDCPNEITSPRALHKQTRYCVGCALKMKKLNTLDPYTVEERREYMRLYMRAYRLNHPRSNNRHVRNHRNRKKKLGLATAT
jgi:predicted Fe-S protein YdhL (DUF1289 family)